MQLGVCDDSAPELAQHLGLLAPQYLPNLPPFRVELSNGALAVVTLYHVSTLEMGAEAVHQMQAYHALLASPRIAIAAGRSEHPAPQSLQRNDEASAQGKCSLDDRNASKASNSGAVQPTKRVAELAQSLGVEADSPGRHFPHEGYLIVPLTVQQPGTSPCIDWDAIEAVKRGFRAIDIPGHGSSTEQGLRAELQQSLAEAVLITAYNR